MKIPLPEDVKFGGGIFYIIGKFFARVTPAKLRSNF